MNYYKIKGSCPKAYALLIKYYSIDESLIGTRYFPEDYLGRNLYDFFDSQGIIVEITKYYHNAGNTKWNYDVSDELNYNLGNNFDEYATRTEAEEKAFEKAFEILEDKL